MEESRFCNHALTLLCVCVRVCKYGSIRSMRAWTSGRRVLEGPVVCVNPLKAAGLCSFGDFCGFLLQLREKLFVATDRTVQV